MRITEHPVLNFERGKELTFTYEDQQLTGYENETIAAALHAHGVRELRHEHRPRGLFCAIGNCSSCLMEVNGVSNVRVCVTKVEEGMVVKKQLGNGDIFSEGEK